MKKILIINTCGLGLGGITIHMINYLSNLSLKNCKADVISTITQNSIMVDRLQEIGCNIINLPNRKKNTLSYLAALNKVFKQTNYDLIHIHGNSSTMIMELFLAKSHNIPIRIAHTHNTICSHPYLNNLMKPLLRLFYTNCFACSYDAGKILFNDNFVILRNAIDLEIYRFNNKYRQKVREELGFSMKDKIIGHIGVFNEQKNQLFLLDIFDKLKDYKEYKLLLIGEGDTKNIFEQKLKNLGLQDRVVILKNRSDIPFLLMAMDIFVFPSRWEGFGIALLEAQASGLKCLVSSVIPEDAILTKSVIKKDLAIPSEQWANCIVDILENEYSREIDSEKNITVLEEKGYSLKKSVKFMEDIYKLNQR